MQKPRIRNKQSNTAYCTSRPRPKKASALSDVETPQLKRLTYVRS